MIPALIIDTETTDRKPPMEVIELAWGEPRGTRIDSVRFQPERLITLGALATDHILPSELKGCPPSDTAILHLPASEYLIGHNIDFDWRALGYPEGKRICTLALSRSLWPDLDSHSLSSLIYFLAGQTPETRTLLRGAHSAAHDVHLTDILLTHILNCLPEAPRGDWASLHFISEEARIPRKMTFGKFEGLPISAVDRGYALWYKRQPDPDPYLLEAFEMEGILP